MGILSARAEVAFIARADGERGALRQGQTANHQKRLGATLVMLEKIKEEIAECHRHAAECRDKAELTDDPEMKRDLLALERSWLFLASSYELSERLSDFTDEAARRKKE